MNVKSRETKKGPCVLDAVALLEEVPGLGLLRGQVGTVVEQLDDESASWNSAMTIAVKEPVALMSHLHRDMKIIFVRSASATRKSL
jgi:hypothetical protein